MTKYTEVWHPLQGLFRQTSRRQALSEELAPTLLQSFMSQAPSRKNTILLGFSAETDEAEQLRVQREYRLHRQIAQELSMLRPNFKPHGINLPYSGPNAASESALLKHIYGAQVQIYATEKERELVTEAKEELARLAKAQVPVQGIYITQGDAHNPASYEQSAKLTIARNVILRDFSQTDPTLTFRQTIQAVHQILPRDGFFVVSLFGGDSHKDETMQALEAEGFRIRKIITNKLKKEEITTSYYTYRLFENDSVIFICEKKKAFRR